MDRCYPSGELFSEMLPERLPTITDVRAAAGRLKGIAVRTPLLESPLLNERLGGRLLLKAEPLQRTGSFKIRGAYNRISAIAPEIRARGVVAFSSGNHAQGVAHAAALLEVPATIVMPRDAPAVKIENTRAYGAEVVLHERDERSRAAVAGEIAEERGATLVRPFNDPDVIAGQGTLGLELAEQSAAEEAELDLLLVPCGGGGLVAGCALAIGEASPETEIYAVEPEGFDDMARSLRSGQRVANEPGGSSICDALLSRAPGELTFAVAAPRLAGGLVVGEEEVAVAMAAAFGYFHLVIEPGGAVALAAALAGKIDCRDRTVGVVASGGNADPALYRDLTARA
ncbi:MAG: threonine/serine dehydratase [Alphaproteobacteria bacterium]|nr:threonine/serine dehydratase [Alphaproteobacteria bacterium]